MNRFSHVDLAAPPFPPCGGGRGAIASCARQRSPRAAQARAPPFPSPAGGQGGRSEWSRCGASSVMKVREGATKARSSSLTSLG